MSEAANLLARIRFVVKSVVANVVKKISPKNTQLSLPGLTRQSIRFAKCPYEDDGPAGQARGRRAEDCGPPFFVIAGHSASKTRVNALMTRQSIRLRKMPLGLAKKMDPRVKPAGDACGTDPVASPSGRTQRRLARSYGAGVNGAATHVEGAHAACGGAGGVRGLERRRPPPPSRLLRRVRRAQPIELRRLAARPRHPKSGTGSRARQRARSATRSKPRSEPRSKPESRASWRARSQRRSRTRPRRSPARPQPRRVAAQPRHPRSRAGSRTRSQRRSYPRDLRPPAGPLRRLAALPL